MTIHLALVSAREAQWGQPLFVDDSGRPVYPARGGDGEGAGEGDDDGDSGADDDADDTDAEDKDEKDSKAGAEADAEVLRKKMRLADKRAAEAERKLRELEDKDKGELEVTQRKLADAEKQLAEVRQKLKDNAIETAFAMVNKFEWEDAEDALELMRRKGFLEDVQDEDGEVDRKVLERKLKEFAKAKPHMLKKKTEEDEEDTDTTSGKPNGPTGQPTGSGRKNKPGTGPTEAELRNRYPALRR